VKPYQQQGSKKTQVGKMFDNIAPYYDFLNRLLSLRMDVLWRRSAIKTIKDRSAKKILDIATGTADLTVEINKQLNPDQIIGMDLSNEMLEVGRQKIAKKGLDHIIRLDQGDSENLQYSDNTFDVATAAFGVLNFENLQAGLTEINRVLKKNGQIVVLEFSRPTIFPFKQLFNLYFKYILPVIGKVTSKDPKAYQYLYESVQAFPDGDDFLAVLKASGFNSNQCKKLSLGICSIYTGFK
ncbi:MAG: bifunctional demethylmenaquinone methyltransferase/2-methoxy-6-polyprenyl-1,4-benzoquinol methylase UbiE, partial [Bacteroidota bacterium]